jgi:ABC-type transport system involved in multi-copper enzyme maturation permease subunit
LFERHWLFLTIVGVLLAGFQVLICAIVSSINIEGAIRELSQSLPPFVQTLISEQFALGLSSRGLIVFAWNHPVVHALLAAAMMLLASRAIAGEIEAGTMELLLSQPLARSTYLATQMLFALVVLLALAGTMLFGVYLGLSLFNLHQVLPWQTFLPVVANLLSLEIAIYSLTLLLSVSARESGRVVTAALLFVLISYLVQAVARLWSKIQFLANYSISNTTRRADRGEQSRALAQYLILLGVGFVAGGLGWWV